MLRQPLIASLTVTGLFAASSHAAVVSFAGSDTTTDANWRTTTTVKALDGDLDNVYGSLGYVAYGTGAPGGGDGNGYIATDPLNYDSTAPGSWPIAKTVKSVPSFLTLASAGQDRVAVGYGYPAVDNPTVTPGTSVSDIELGLAVNNGGSSNRSLVSLTIGSGAPATFRVGIFTIGAIDQASRDQFASVTLAQTTGGSGTATATNAVSTDDGGVEYYFFDVTGAAPGDVFTFSGTNSSLSAGVVGYAGLTFDAVPEPASLALLGMGAALVGFRRR